MRETVTLSKENETGNSDTEGDDDDGIAAFAKIAVINESDFDDSSEGALLSFPETDQKETIKEVHINPRLDSAQQAEVWTLLREFQDIFSDVPGQTNLGEHRIELTTKEPTRVKPYLMPSAKRQAVQEEVGKDAGSGHH